MDEQTAQQHAITNSVVMINTGHASPFDLPIQKGTMGHSGPFDMVQWGTPALLVVYVLNNNNGLIWGVTSASTRLLKRADWWSTRAHETAF